MSREASHEGLCSAPTRYRSCTAFIDFPGSKSRSLERCSLRALLKTQHQRGRVPTVLVGVRVSSSRAFESVPWPRGEATGVDPNKSASSPSSRHSGGNKVQDS
jgi:hypothetical protein